MFKCNLIINVFRVNYIIVIIYPTTEAQVMKFQCNFSDDRFKFLSDARKISSDKTEFNGIKFFNEVTLDIGDDGFATKGKVTSRSYTLGTYEKYSWSNQAGLDFRKKEEFLGMDSPSKIQSKLTSRGVFDFNVAKHEAGTISACIEEYNASVRRARKHQCDIDFDKRKDGFLKELYKLKERFAVKFEIGTDWVDYNEEVPYVNLVDTLYDDSIRYDEITDVL